MAFVFIVVCLLFLQMFHHHEITIKIKEIEQRMEERRNRLREYCQLSKPTNRNPLMLMRHKRGNFTFCMFVRLTIF